MPTIKKIKLNEKWRTRSIRCVEVPFKKVIEENTSFNSSLQRHGCLYKRTSKYTNIFECEYLYVLCKTCVRVNKGPKENLSKIY